MTAAAAAAEAERLVGTDRRSESDRPRAKARTQSDRRRQSRAAGIRHQPGDKLFTDEGLVDATVAAQPKRDDTLVLTARFPKTDNTHRGQDYPHQARVVP
jgi:hypothetical protein